MMRAVIVPTRRARDLQLLPGASDDRLPSRAPIVNYDRPEHNSSIKIKALTTGLTENTVKSWAAVSGWYKKF
jgi:hypothetical protein